MSKYILIKENKYYLVQVNPVKDKAPVKIKRRGNRGYKNLKRRFR